MHCLGTLNCFALLDCVCPHNLPLSCTTGSVRLTWLTGVRSEENKYLSVPNNRQGVRGGAPRPPEARNVFHIAVQRITQCLSEHDGHIFREYV